MTGIKVSWVYRLTKEQLQVELEKHGVTAEGTLSELRQRMVNFVRKNPEKFTEKPDDHPDYNEAQDITNDNLADEAAVGRTGANASTPIRPDAPPTIFINQEGPNKILDQIRKWNCHFDGKDLYGFLERAEELRRAYGYTHVQLYQGIPELLKGEALQWYRNNAASLHSCAEVENNLRRYYIPANERKQLTRQISDKQQGQKEPIRSFCTSLATLMRRRGGYSEEEQLDVIYDNMKPEFRLYLQRDTVRNLTDLIQRVENIEITMKEIKKEDKTATKETAVIQPNTVYNRNECCWKCKQRGHTRMQCKNTPKLFCSVCGKDGVMTKNCHGFKPTTKPGNATRTGAASAPVNPRSEAPEITEFSSQS